MKQLILISTLLVSSLFSMAQWTNLGLNAYLVNDLTVYADTLYASTENGIYKKHLTTLDSAWTACGMQGHHVVQTLVENHETFYSLITIDGTYTNQLYKSVDGGDSFGLMTESISNSNEYQFLDQMATPPNDFSTFYLLNHQLKSDDGGTTWEPLNNSQNTDRFIMVNPTNTDQVIIGGEADFFNPIVQLSHDNGETWDFPAMTGYFSGDNALHDIAIDGDTWYAAGEGVICKTEDEGENWVQLLNWFALESIYALYYTNIDFSPASTGVLYVTGLNNTNANEVPLLISENQGATWDTIHYQSPPAVQRVQCMTVEHMNNTDYVYIGGKGVFLYNKVVMGVADAHSTLNFSLFPNPTADGRVRVDYRSQSIEPITIQVFDLQGRLMIQERRPAMTDSFFIDTSALSGGTYVLQMVDGSKIGSKEFVVR